MLTFNDYLTQTLGLTFEMYSSLPKETQQCMLNSWSANNTDTPVVSEAKAVEPKSIKFVAKTDKPMVWERKGTVLYPSYGGGSIHPEGAWKSDVAAAVWYVNNTIINDKFGDDVEFRKPTKNSSEPGYVCKSAKVADKLEKLQLRDYVTKDEWNTWVDIKTDKILKAAEAESDRLEALKLK